MVELDELNRFGVPWQFSNLFAFIRACLGAIVVGSFRIRLNLPNHTFVCAISAYKPVEWGLRDLLNSINMIFMNQVGRADCVINFY